MSKVTAILKNPVLLGAQGFLVGALVMLANPQLIDMVAASEPEAPPPVVQIVPVS